MKKIFILILLMVTPLAVSAVACYSNTGGSTPNTNCTINCSNPATLLNNGLQICGYVNQPNPNPSYDTCYDYYNPTYSGYFSANGVVVNNCMYYTPAPINSGLIFLIIAGGGLGLFMLYKKNSQTNNPSSL